jgi:glycosyltransferase involved in cell wall biosynthesis
MKILMLSPYLPYPLLSGGQIRTYNLLKKLSKKHQITLFALIKDESEKAHIPELKKFCHEVKVFKRSEKPFTLQNIIKTGFSSYPFLVVRNYVPEVIGAVKKSIARNDYDLIHAETFYMMPHIPRTSIPIILAEQTIEYLGYESYAKKAPIFLKPFLNIDIKKIKFWEKFYWNACQRLIVMSDADRQLISLDVKDPDKISVVENGVDTSWFSLTVRNEPAVPTILSVGTFKWLPNVESVSYLVKSVWPKIKEDIPRVRLNIVGNDPTPKILAFGAQDKQISVIGRVEDIRTAFNSAHVLLAPVFSGKGTRYKVLEAMATGTPVVATPIAVEGLEVIDNKHVLIANTAEEMAQKTLLLIDNPALRLKLAKAGKEFVTQKYDWELIATKLDNIYKAIT